MFSDLKLYSNPDVKKSTRIAIIKFKDKRRAESAVDCLTGSILKDQQIFLELEEVGYILCFMLIWIMWIYIIYRVPKMYWLLGFFFKLYGFLAWKYTFPPPTFFWLISVNLHENLKKKILSKRSWFNVFLNSK